MKAIEDALIKDLQEQWLHALRSVNHKITLKRLIDASFYTFL